MPPCVLCIDDRPEMLEIRKAVLESSGYHVETVTSGYAAIERLRAASVDAVLLEYKQQGIDAEAIACHIHRQFPNIPIVLLSAYFEMPDRILWLVDAYVMRSELPEGLVRVIEKVTHPTNTETVPATNVWTYIGCGLIHLKVFSCWPLSAGGHRLPFQDETGNYRKACCLEMVNVAQTRSDPG